MNRSSKKTESITMRMIALAIGVLFVFATALAIVIVPTEYLLFRPETIKSGLQDANLYPQIPDLIARQIVYDLNKSGCPPGDLSCQEEQVTLLGQNIILPAFFQNLTQEDWAAILNTLITPEWLHTQTESVIDQFFTYLNGSSPELTLKISMETFKARLSGEEGLALFLGLIRTQPSCSSEEILKILKQLLLGSNLNQAPLCNPSEQVLAQVTPEISKILVATANTIPNEIDLASSMKTPSGQGRLAAFRNQIQTWRTLARFSPLLPALLLLVITALVVRSIRSLLVWWGSLFVVGGFAGALLGLAWPLLINFMQINYILYSLIPAGLEPTLSSPLADLLRYVFRQVTIAAIIEGGVLATLGVIMLVIALMLRPSVKGYRPTRS